MVTWEMPSFHVAFVMGEVARSTGRYLAMENGMAEFSLDQLTTMLKDVQSQATQVRQDNAQSTQALAQALTDLTLAVRALTAALVIHQPTRE